MNDHTHQYNPPVTGSTTGTIGGTWPPQPQVCPTCGTCPTCGARTNQYTYQPLITYTTPFTGQGQGTSIGATSGQVPVTWTVTP